jgi:lysophospholipase L1-like esterase
VEATPPRISPSKRRLFIAAVLALSFAVAETATAAFYRTEKGRRYEKLRLRLLGLGRSDFQKAIGQPYLLYIPTPNLVEDGVRQHNEQGYRGRAVPMRRTPGVLRVLCLGGSTTYGWGVARPEETFPARLEEALARRRPGGPAVEVINAGLPWGTSAELLTHYCFKFHYYKPDLVIVDTGGNDALPLLQTFYQPDYSHTRQQMPDPKPLPSGTRWLLHSRLASLVAILAFFGPLDEGTIAFVRTEPGPPPASWYPGRPVGPDGRPFVPRDENAFVHNVETLVTLAKADGAKLLLVPFRSAPNNGYAAPIQEKIVQHEELLRGIAQETSSSWAPFPASVISPGDWVDNCHLNGEGERQKADYLLPWVERALGLAGE